MKIVKTEIDWINNILVNIFYFPIKTLSFSSIDYINNIIGVYSPIECGKTMIKDIIFNNIINHHLINLNKYEYTFQERSFLENNCCFYILGERYNVYLIKSQRNELYIDETNKYIRICKKNKEYIKLMENIAIEKLTPIVDYYLNIYSKKMGLKGIKFLIKRVDKYYGQCDYTKNTIYISTNMFNFPIKCIEEVVVHELSHFFCHDHGLKFFKTMDKYFPAWRASTWSEVDCFPTHWSGASPRKIKIGPY